MTTVLMNEALVWESKRNLDRHHIEKGAESIRIIISRIGKQISMYLGRKPPPLMSRKMREIYQMKQRELLDSFRREKCRIEMMKEDGDVTQIDFHISYQDILLKFLMSIQPFEQCLNSNLEKYKLRLTGYPKVLIRELHERDDMREGNILAKHLWDTQCHMAAIIAGEAYCDTECRNNHPTSYLEVMSYLQYHEVVLAKDSANVENKLEVLPLVFIECISILNLLKRWTDVSLVPLVLTQCMRTLRACLTFLGGDRLRAQRSESLDSSVTQFVDARDQHTSVSWAEWREHTMELASSLTHWMRLAHRERRKPSVAIPLHEPQREEALQACPHAVLRGCVSFTSPLVQDILTCAKCVLMLMVHDQAKERAGGGDWGRGGASAGDGYQEFIDDIVDCGEGLCMTVLTQLSERTNAIRKPAVGDVRTAESFVGEVVAVLEFAASCYTSGSMSCTLLDILTISREVRQVSRFNLMIQASWMQAFLCAILAVNVHPEPVATEADMMLRRKNTRLAIMKAKSLGEAYDGPSMDDMSDKEKLVKFLGSCTHDILCVMIDHVACSSLQWRALLVFRLLLRAPYTAQQEMEMMMEVTAPEVAEAEVAEEGQGQDQQTEQEKEKADQDDVALPTLDDWRAEQAGTAEFQAISCEHQYGFVHLCGVMVLCIEHNLQCSEVVEQWLLLVRHVCVATKVGRRSLVSENGYDWVKKVLSLQTSNVYLIALGEICLEALDA